MSNPGKLSAEVISQISLMQSFVSHLPTEKSIFDFVNQGIKDIPGLLGISMAEPDDSSLYDSIEKMHISVSGDNYEVFLLISDSVLYKLYQPYLANLFTMIQAVLTARKETQRRKELIAQQDQKIAFQTEEIRARNEYLEMLLTSIADGVVVVDESDMIVSLNPAAEMLLGVTCQKYLGNQLKEVYEVVEYVDNLSSGQRQGRDAIVVCANGDRRYVSESVSVFSTAMKEKSGKIIVFRDVTSLYIERISQQERVSRVRKYQDAFVAFSHNYSVLESNHNAAMRVATEMLAELFGAFRVSVWEYNEARSKLKCRELYKKLEGIHESGEEKRKINSDSYFDSLNKNLSVIAASLDEQELSTDLMQTYYCKNHVESFCDFAFKIDGKPYGVLSIEMDTQREWSDDDCSIIRAFADQIALVILSSRYKQTEKQLSSSRKMEAVGQLAGGVAHDFNNMLGGIVGASELLQSGQFELSAKALKYIKMIEKAAHRAAELTSKLLVFSRKSSSELKPFSLHAVVKDAVALLERGLDKKVEIQTKLDAKADIVFGDSAQIQSAIMNLCINANHAMVDGGLIEVTTELVYLNEAYCNASSFQVVPGQYLEVEVKDNGSGIPYENLTKIFEPFFTTKPIGKGTGLGLSAVYGTVVTHHGVIKVYSERGVGTVFHIYLPLSSAVESIVDDAQLYCDSPLNILLVDDEEIIRDTAKSLLEDVGHTVHVAENGVKGYELFIQEDGIFDLIILDMIMPKMSGLELYDKIREIDTHIPVIVASGFSKEKELEQMQASGLSGFIKKPFRRAELLQVIQRVMSVK